MTRWLFVDGQGVLFEVAPRNERARKALPGGVDVAEPDLLAALAAADGAVAGAEAIHTERDERDYWVAYWRAFLRHLGLPESHAAVMHREALWVRHARLYPEVPDVFGQIQDAGYRIGLISNGPPTIALGLSQMGVVYFFDSVTVSTEAGVRKPDPRIFRLALATAGAEPSDAWFVDDQPAHVRAAAQLGMRALLIDRQGGRGEIQSLADLPRKMRQVDGPA
ncbi:MAG: HAD family hydrolase [Bacillota bacterium]